MDCCVKSILRWWQGTVVMDGEIARGHESSVEVKVHSISASNPVDEKEPAGRISFGAIGCISKNETVELCVTGQLGASLRRE